MMLKVTKPARKLKKIMPYITMWRRSENTLEHTVDAYRLDWSVQITKIIFYTALV